MANIGGGGAGPSNQPAVGGGDTSHGGFSNVDDDPLFTDADLDVLITNIGGGGAGLSNQPGGGVDPVSGAFSGYLAADANFSVDDLLNNIGGGGAGLSNQPGGGVDPVSGAFSGYLATDANFSVDDLLNNIGGGGAALSNQPGGGVDPVSGAFSDYLATDANFSIDDLTNNIGGGGGGAAGLSNQLRAGGDPSHGGFRNLDDDPIITEAAAGTLITNIGGGGGGAVGLSNQLGVGGDSLQGGFRNLDDDPIITEAAADTLIKDAKGYLKEVYADLHDSLPESFRIKDLLLEAHSEALNLLNQISKEYQSNFLSLPSVNPLFRFARYQLMDIPADHLKAVISDPVPYLPRGPYSVYNSLDRSVHHRAAAGFCAVVAADMWVVTDQWARIYGLASGLTMEQCFVLARSALSLLYPDDKVFGEDGLTTFHVPLVKYFEYLAKLRVNGLL